MLPFSGAITDFALATDAKGVFQGVMRLALVQAKLGTTWSCRGLVPLL